MKKRQTKILVLGAMLCLLAAACRQPAVIYDSHEKVTEPSEAEAGTEVQEGQMVSSVCVYVCGEVQEPGVYELPADARLADAIEAAGGMTEAAAKEYLNLAEYVTDGQKIEVPSEQEAREWEAAKKEEAKSLVNLNLASAEQLMTLTGIGEAKAKDILNYREKQGGFSSVEELMEIPGIKSGVFQKIKDQITV